MEFVDFEVAADFDYNRLAFWTEKATVVPKEPPVSYEQDDIAIYAGVPYRCQIAVCASGLVPPDNPTAWQKLPPFPDDMLLAPDSAYTGIGLLPTDVPETVFLPLIIR
ncbi:MAG: hypothetical protein GFH27_549287n319 [Chloroflexi bacterium AL-W]|nr:hypothetical protein [Chloroflexi bacterium AL-N1]NOK66593.1 hypothetical protein [Chloroflexi bacterium AL-N10]NOK71981.1 hypothetical protein [Chloroflexi bacterium AL-N5]NOK81238.1 hypothetical protein [Chloroflexi bacterium AL-W]NOK89511.1 hypothetical protein [Chloroflexi bacterium AL-N15]